MKTQKLTELALLSTVALIIFVIELKIPNLVPVPGVKLGLSNIITVYAVYHYSAKETGMILFSRIVLGAFFGGQMISLLYSLAGGMMCLVGMLFLSKVIHENRIWICSILGAVCHNIGQILIAVLLTQTLGVLLYLPVLMVTGIIAGAFTGLCAQQLIQKKGWENARE